MKTSVVAKATGSAYFQCGNTKIITAIYGPRQSPKMKFVDTGRFYVDFRYAPFAQSTRRALQQREDDERECSRVLEDAISSSIRLEAYPKAMIEAFVFVIDDDGSALSCAISCTSLALANSGIEMFGLVTACNITLDLELDPSSDEQLDNNSALISCISSPLNQITFFHHTGTMSSDKFSSLLYTGSQWCSDLFRLISNFLTSQVT